MAKRLIIAGILALVATISQSADNSELKMLTTGNDSHGWEAVGRLNFAGQSFCTGALIAPDLVLTAAHCLFDSDSGQAFRTGDIEFLAGWRNGRANAESGIARAIAHPEFALEGLEQSNRVSFDLALLQLNHPIRKSSVTPFETEDRPRKGAAVGVVSYARERAESASLQEVCHVLARRSGTLVLSCDVDFGSSGAPVFSFDDEGQAKIVSVISAKAEVNGQNVSLGTSLKKPLGDLMALMAHANTSATEAKAEVRVIRLGNSNGGNGAKFVRP